MQFQASRVEMNEVHLNRLCVGSSFIALLYALRTSTPCIIHNAQKIFSHTDELKNFDFSMIANNPSDIWDRVCFLLSMSGLLLFPDNIQSFRKEDDYVDVITKYNKKTTVYFDELVEFDNRKTKHLSVYDYFWCRVGSSHEVDLIEDNEDFVNKIIFYPRPEKPNTKDLICVSRIHEDALQDFEKSPSYARLKTIALMREGGIKGIKTGMQNGKPCYVPPKVEWEKRLVHFEYSSDMSLAEVYNLQQEENYAWMLLKNTTRHIFTSQE